MYFMGRERLYNEAIANKLNYAHKNKLTHVPRYLVLVLWVLFVSFVIYAYANVTLFELTLNDQSIEQSIQSTPIKQKSIITLEFLPNEPVPKLVSMPDQY